MPSLNTVTTAIHCRAGRLCRERNPVPPGPFLPGNFGRVGSGKFQPQPYQERFDGHWHVAPFCGARDAGISVLAQGAGSLGKESTALDAKRLNIRSVPRY